MIYKNFIIKENKNHTYTVYFENGEFFTNYMKETLNQVKKDLNFWNKYI